MIVSEELSAWAGDKARLRETQARVDGFAREWSGGPVHTALDARMAAIREPGAAAVARAVSEIFSDEQWVSELIAAVAARMRTDPFFEPPFRPLGSEMHSGLILYEDDNLTIVAGVCRIGDIAAKKSAPSAGGSIGFTGQVSVIKFVKAGGARVGFWEAPLITADFSAARAGACRKVSSRTVRDGETIIVDGRFEGYIIERARANLLILQAVIKRDSAPLSVDYDAHSLAYVGCSATDDGASRIQMITTLVRKLGRDSAFPTVAAFLDHPAFFVRWHVMRELLGMDAKAALPHLRRMAASDPHPENRRVAEAVLARFPTSQEPERCPA